MCIRDRYSIAGAMMGLLGIFFFTANAVTPLFVPGGTLSPDAVASQGPLLLWVLLIKMCIRDRFSPACCTPSAVRF